MNYVRTHSCQDLITHRVVVMSKAHVRNVEIHIIIFPLNELCGFRGLINTNWIEILVTIFYRRGTLNKLKFDLIKKHSSDLCKRNANKIWCLSFLVLEKIRRNFAKLNFAPKFRQSTREFSSNEISPSSWRNFASTEAKFRRSENSHPRNFAG